MGEEISGSSTFFYYIEQPRELSRNTYEKNRKEKISTSGVKYGSNGEKNCASDPSGKREGVG